MIEINGADELVGFLKEKATMDDVKEAVRINTTEMQNQAMRNTSIFTGHFEGNRFVKPSGNLKRMITIEFSSGGYVGKVTSSAAYAVYPEYGTRFMNARSYFRPAWHKQKIQFEKDMGRLMDKR